MRVLLAALVALLICAGLPLTVPAPSAHAQDRPMVHLEVDNITPSVVEGQNEVTVTGTLTNQSDYGISGLEARIERGAAVQTPAAAEEAVLGDSPRLTQPSFTSLPFTLEPGQHHGFRMTVPLSGGADSLEITDPGSYPLTVNVNGTPNYGNRARVAETNFMLPVVATPDTPSTRPERPLPTSMLVPIVDYPRAEGTEGGKPVLTDDQLGDSLARGGRLHELVRAINEGVRQDSPLGNSLCFAIDPDVLVTADSMRNGYRVRQPDGTTKSGAHAAAANEWLDQLKQATANRCVMALPFSDADVAALGRADLPDLIKGSRDGSAYLKQLLNVEPRKDLFWPIDGALNPSAADALGKQDVKTMLMRPEALSAQGNPLAPARLNTQGSPAVKPIDPLLAKALNPPDDGPPTAMRPQTNGPLSTQDALGALAYRATTGASPESVALLAPPRRWNLGGDDLRSLLNGMETMQRAGYIEPSSWKPEPETGSRQAKLRYSMAGREITQPVLKELAKQNYKVGDLYASSEKDPATDVDRAEVTNPLRNALLRGASSAWRGSPAASREWVRTGTDRLREVLSAVQVETTPTVVSNSRIPVKVTNDLPIRVNVELRTARVAGIRITPLGQLEVPQGSRSFYPEVEVNRAGRFTVDIVATTPGGTKLGSSRRVQMESTNYGAFIPVLTTGAGGLLIVLVGTRIVRRVRARGENSAAGSTTSDGDAGSD